MYVLFYFLGIFILCSQGRGEYVRDCTNTVDGNNSTQTCKESLDHKDIKREAPSEFICQLEGRFPDLSDPTCKRYFQCDRVNNGTFNKQLLKCPSSNSSFCGSTQKCSSKYVCPCDGTSSSEMQTSGESYGNLVKVTTHPCSVSLEADFNCLSVGRFPDFNDLGCQAYFLCSHLYNGSYIKTKYTCRNSFFDPGIKKCSVNFTCPCAVTANTPPITITTATSQHVTNGIISTSAGTASTAFPSASHTTSENVTDLSTKHGCTILSKEFECINEGRFPDLSDVACRMYFLCSKLQNGTFIKTSYECKYSTFNPLLLRCSTGYICPCTGEQTTFKTTPISPLSTQEANKTLVTNPLLSSTVTSSVSSGTTGCAASSQEFECTVKGRFADLADFTCKKYFLCSQLQNGTLIKTKYTCPSTSTFYPPNQQCSSEYICPCSSLTATATVSSTNSMKPSTLEASATIPTISSETPMHSTSLSITPIENATVLTTSLPVSSETPGCHVSVDDFMCTSEGRFPDFMDFTCQKYFLCSHLRNGTFIKTKYRCPNSSIFYPPSEKCSTKYICPCATTTDTSTSSPVSFTMTSSLNLSTVENAKTNSSEILTTSTVSFGNTNTFPTSNYSTSSVGCTVSYNKFECTIAGRFPDLSDTTCRKYFLCSELRNGTFIETPYTCLNSTFNPLLFQCSIGYVCPCNAEYTSATTPMNSISTTEGFTMLPTTTAIITTASYTCNSHSHSVSEFKCFSVGRFADYSDITCRKYFLCSQLQNGTFIKTSYSCPPSSCINSSMQRCSTSCKCPCL